jgi:phenylpropionate dioxygenase-like ring-hydroxylating dioxygenase large terminal subunit
VIPVEALGRKFAVFRTQQGELGAVKAQCCHIGADLSRGWVEGERLICPLHMWAFDTQGKCRHIPCQDSVPERLRQDAMRCSERYGVVYGYLGGEEEFPLPYYEGVEHGISSKALIIDFDSPYEMAGANSFDEQHLATVHRRDVINGQKIFSDSPEHFAIEYRARVTPHTTYDKLLHLIGKKEVHMRLDCWGGNLLLFSHVGTPNRMIISLLPRSEKQTRAFISTVLPKSSNRILFPFQHMAAFILNRFTMMFVQQDVRALQGMDFKFINVLPEADATMVKWYQYWKNLPRVEITCSKVES